MNDPEAKLSALFARADDAYRPTGEDLARLDARTLPLVTGGLPPPSPRSWRRAAGYGGAGLGVALLAFAAWKLAAAEPHAPPDPLPSAPITVAAPSVTAPPSVDEGLPAISVDSLPTVSAPRPAAPPSAPEVVKQDEPSSLEEEVRLIRGATDRRRAGDAVTALTLLEEHARRFPAGVLADQRDVERIVALCDENAIAQARERARAFFAVRPGSPLAARVRASCAGSVEQERP